MHDQHVLELYRSPRYFYPVSACTHQGGAVNQYCGDEITLYANISKGIIRELCYQGSACSVCLASAELVCQKFKDMNVSDLQKYSKEELLSEFGLTIEDKRANCAVLVFDAIEQLVESV